jgi:hypothetical protein
VTIKLVRLFPPMACWSILVNLDSLYGTCMPPWDKSLITLPRTDRLELILLA